MAIQDSLQDRKAKGYKIAQQKQIWITKDGWKHGQKLEIEVYNANLIIKVGKEEDE